MKIYAFLFLGIACISNAYIQDDLETIKSKVATQDDYQFASSLDELQNGEKWGFHSRLLGKAETSSWLKSNKGINYGIENIGDFNLKTAWVEGGLGYGIGEYFKFAIIFDPGTQYGSSGQFNGILELFNGYCKSEKIWKQNSRVKRLKMYLNSTPICFIELQDTWQYQSVNVCKFFKNFENDQYLDAKYVLKEGDELKFEIVDAYAGDRYKDVALSEFVAEGAPN